MQKLKNALTKKKKRLKSENLNPNKKFLFAMASGDISTHQIAFNDREGIKNIKINFQQRRLFFLNYNFFLSTFFAYKNIQLCFEGKIFFLTLKRAANELINDYTNRGCVVDSHQHTKRSILAF